MFSFFKRNKNSSSSSSKSNNNNNSSNISSTTSSNENLSKTSINIQNAIERQQASLQQMLDLRRKSKDEVNDREQRNNENLHSSNIEESLKNRSYVLPSSLALVNEISINKTNILQASDTCAKGSQNYDQFRDARRRNNTPLLDSIEFAPRQTVTTKSYTNSSSFYSPTTVALIASSITTDFIETTSPSTSNDINSNFEETMGRGRNRNKQQHQQNHRGQNSNNVVKNQSNVNGNGSVQQQKVLNQNCNKNSNNNNNTNNVNIKKINVKSDVVVNNDEENQKIIKDEVLKNEEKANSSAHADVVEYSEKSASISLCENVFFHDDENSCSKNSQTLEERNRREDNIATSDEDDADDDDDDGEETEIENQVEVSESHHRTSSGVEEHQHQKNGMKNDESDDDEQQVNGSVPLQKSHSAKRVTFAPSPPRSRASSESDNDEEETTSEDIFYEAADASPPVDASQKLKILSTITSHNSDLIMTRIDEESPTMLRNGESSSEIVSASMILSLDAKDNDNQVENAFNGTSSADSTPKTMKPSYVLVGDDPIALPDIVAETSLLEHHQQHHNNSNNIDEMATLVSQTSSQHGSCTSNGMPNSKKVEVVDQMQVKVNELCTKIDELQRELDQKSGTIDRLQSEIVAANKDGESVRMRLRYQDTQLEKLKETTDLEEDVQRHKYDKLEQQFRETVGKLQKMQSLASNLNVQLAQTSVDVEKLRQERDEILDKLTAQEKLLRDVLQTSVEEREQLNAKWKNDFEQLRNVNCDREEHLMEDCEWKLRQMMKQCKDKIDKVEKEKLALKDQAQADRETIKTQRDEIKSLKSCEVEVNHLRGLNTEQKDSIKSMMRRIDDLNSELNSTRKRLQKEIDSALQIKRDCAYQLSEKERSAVNRIEIARGEIAMEWEERLMEEMCRLTSELEQVHLEERNKALDKLKGENLNEIQNVISKQKHAEQKLLEEIKTCKVEIEQKQQELRDTQTKADMHLLEHRSYLDRKEREFQKDLDNLQRDMERQERRHSDLIDEIKLEHKREKDQIKASFYNSLEQIKEEFANEITLTTETLQVKHKKDLEEQWKQLVHEKEAALQKAETRHKIKLEDAENNLSALKVKHQRQISDLRDQYDVERSRYEIHDVSNAQEIDNLRKKCICLTRLFEEMRMRYERRDPRPEDLRQIDELKAVTESQEKDIFHLTEQLRDLQLQHQTLQQQFTQQTNNNNNNQSKRNKNKNNKNNNNLKSQNNNQQKPPTPASTDPQPQINSNINENENQQQTRTKPPPLIKTVIYEEENENELYEEQLREERENAKKMHQHQHFSNSSSSGGGNHVELQNGVMVELVPESPDYLTKQQQKHEEISEAQIITDNELLSNVPIVVVPMSSGEKCQEIQIEVISTIEPSNIQIVTNCNGKSTFESEF